MPPQGSGQSPLPHHRDTTKWHKCSIHGPLDIGAEGVSMPSKSPDFGARDTQIRGQAGSIGVSADPGITQIHPKSTPFGTPWDPLFGPSGALMGGTHGGTLGDPLGPCIQGGRAGPHPPRDRVPGTPKRGGISHQKGLILAPRPPK